jgi:hypothetical protein
MLQALEAKLDELWHQLDGEAADEAKALLADAKERLAKFGPLITEAEDDVKSLISEDGPALKEAIAARIAQLVKDAEGLLAAEV